MKEEVADVVFVDPPYNVPVDGHVSGKGKVRHREFAQASGELKPGRVHLFLGEKLWVTR
jgi:16S rRNA G966 N2-methylase RsmD